MTKRVFKRILLVTGSVFSLLIIVLCVHIYMVTRQQPLNANTRGIIRIDFKQHINQTDAGKIINWLYKQKGVENVSCNAENDFAVLIIHPALYNPDQLVADMNTALNYNGIRLIPSEKDIKSGCPVATTSWTYKVYNFFSHI